MKGRPEHALSELKIEAWRNGIRLFRDACTLYRAESFSSSFALAVLAFEELGKVYGIDRICACACLNPESADEWISEFLSRGLLKNHRWKQQSAYVDSLLGSQSSTGPSIGIESLDYAKQQAIYVELENGCVLTPSLSCL